MGTHLEKVKAVNSATKVIDPKTASL